MTKLDVCCDVGIRSELYSTDRSDDGSCNLVRAGTVLAPAASDRGRQGVGLVWVWVLPG